MEVNPKILSEATKDFKKSGITSTSLLMRKHKINVEMAVMIRDTIEKRFPNLWREGQEKFIKDYIRHR